MMLSLGACLGAISVVLGALAAHAWKGALSFEQMNMIDTAIRYQQLHCMMVCFISGISLTNQKWAQSKLIQCNNVLFLIGTILFSFSIYFSVLLDAPWLVKITPWGGSTLILAWLLLAWNGWKEAKLAPNPWLQYTKNMWKLSKNR